MIDRALGRLGEQLEQLGVRRDWRSRVLDEARDHLEELAAAEGEEVAVRRFGDTDAVARLVAAQLATAATRGATYLAFGALALAGLVYAASLALVRAAGGWPDVTSGTIGALGPVLAIALVVLPQIAFVSGSLALLRVMRTRRAPTATEAELSLIRRRTVVALVAGAGTLAALGLTAANDAAALSGWWVSGTIAACFVLTVPLAYAAARLARSATPRAASGGRAGDVFDDLAPMFALPAIRNLELPRHPWRFAALVATAVGLGSFVAGWYAEGDPGSGIVRGVFESVALLICFACLGRFLGLRRSSG